MSYRVAIGSLLTECNQLTGKTTALADFERTELRRGKAVLEVTAGVVGGMLQTLRARGIDIQPLVVASAVPGGVLTSACYHQLKGELLASLQEALPCDALLLALHGGAAVQNQEDLEGDLLESVRQVVGPVRPVVATLDLHAHVTEKMVRDANALVAWETYPHRDTFSTGCRGASLLLDTLDGKVKPTMVMAKVPVLVGAINGSTEGDGPFAEVMRFAKTHEGTDGVLSTSVFLVQPYLDAADMGGGGLVITNNDLEGATTLALEIAWKYWERRFHLDPKLYTPAEAIALGMKVVGGPILLVETADCCGGGAAGDSVASLKALLNAQVPETSVVPVVDPEAAAHCHEKGVGQSITVALGHKLDPQWGKPISVSGRIEKLGDGRFRYAGGIWDAQGGNMGPCAVLQAGSVQVLISTHPTYDWADEQFRSMGIDALKAKFIVVKNPMNFRLGYAGVYKDFYVLDTPGPTPATLHRVKYKKLQRPYYPADSNIPNLRPVLLRHA
jgi:microcystin degradation protein MlrC